MLGGDLTSNLVDVALRTVPFTPLKNTVLWLTLGAKLLPFIVRVEKPAKGVDVDDAIDVIVGIAPAGVTKSYKLGSGSSEHPIKNARSPKLSIIISELYIFFIKFTLIF
jgi:hypothetical protein